MRGFNFGRVGGGTFGRFVLRFAAKDKNHVSCYRLANPKGKSGSFTKSCEILLLLKLLVTPTLTPDIFHHFPPHPF